MTAVTIRSPRRIALAAIAAALLGSAVLLAATPAPASASYGQCDPGDFCLYYYTTLRGGIYHFYGDDPNLNNDRFEGAHTNQIVGDDTTSAFNRGRPAAQADVLIYSQPGYRGITDCIRRYDRGELPFKWWNTIESYKWVNRRVCNAVGVIDLKQVD